jgi:pantothenate kinase-related protein Tda10
MSTIIMTFSQPDQIPDDIVVPASGDIRDAIADFTHKLLDAWNEKHPFVVQFKTTQGTGKTTGVMDSLEVRGPVAALGPRHDDINEDVQG